jgi:hypothetical protein
MMFFKKASCFKEPGRANAGWHKNPGPGILEKGKKINF